MPAFRDLYTWGLRLRRGEQIMIAGRSGSQKSGLALYLADEMNLSTIYFSADMSPFTASSRVACKRNGLTTEEVEEAMKDPAMAEVVTSNMADSKIRFCFAKPLTWRAIEEEIDAFIETEDAYPELLVVDNLMDFEGGDTDYAAQMGILQDLNDFGREMGSTQFVMHHASDKSWEAKTDPWAPPGRQEIKNGLSEKPEATLTVALDPTNLTYRIAVPKQRMGRSDPSARDYVVLKADPARTMFHPLEQPL